MTSKANSNIKNRLRKGTIAQRPHRFQLRSKGPPIVTRVTKKIRAVILPTYGPQTYHQYCLEAGLFDSSSEEEESEEEEELLPPPTTSSAILSVATVVTQAWPDDRIYYANTRPLANKYDSDRSFDC